MQDFKEIQYKDHGFVKEIILNNPKKFNILSLNMMDEMIALLNYLEKEISPSLVIIKGMGDHFCSGGNLFEVIQPQGGPKYVANFAKIISSLKLSKKHTFLSLLKGFTIGSGLSLGIICHYSVATDTTLGGMPETKIGTSPNCALKFMEVPNFVGKYLWLSSALLTGEDLVKCKVITNYMERQNYDIFEDEVKKIKKIGELNPILEKYSKKLESPWEPLEAVKTVYKHEKIEDIYRAAETLANTDPRGKKLLSELNKVSPFALKVSTELWNRITKTSSYQEALSLEVKACIVMTQIKDFHEGLQVLKKKKPVAQWQHKSIFDVPQEEVLRVFEPSQQFRGSL